MRRFAAALVATYLAFAAAPAFAANTADDDSARRLAAAYADLAESEENATALVLALRNGERAQLVHAAPHEALPEVTLLEPPTGALTWSAVEIALANARAVLASAGIVHPTAPQLVAALLGGVLGVSQGKPLEVPGVLHALADIR